ncbi:hypothetical protein [Pseudomonas amygdali]|uniref:hypothetical protein n=1 Tax=Pseudomonas amygdali TaxID=47877 RepID=UPI0006E5FE6F|nr:hypothetical protein [Pseudomonas amygdali]KPY55625.1 hypothetical protein ALO93_200060 [Pseudomonas amygdali pv. sesami]
MKNDEIAVGVTFAMMVIAILCVIQQILPVLSMFIAGVNAFVCAGTFCSLIKAAIKDSRSPNAGSVTSPTPVAD